MKASLDHYVHRPVEDVFETDAGFAIRLEGDVIIHSFDKEREVPSKEIVGMTFATLLLGESDTKMIFQLGGNMETQVTVSMTPTKYYIADPSYSEPQYPQESEVDDALRDRPDEPAERLQYKPAKKEKAK